MVYFGRPYIIDAKINQKVEKVESYLEQHHPSEEWTIVTVPHREEGYKHLNPYYIGVVFEREPDTIYYYWVENEDDIEQIGHSTKTRL